MTWHTRPADQGQIVHIEYAADGEYLYRRITDTSDRSVSMARVSWDWLSDSITGEFAPWNGDLGADVDESDWRSVEVAS